MSSMTPRNGNSFDETVVVTGGNSGLGFECARAILKSPRGAGSRIILACRDTRRAQDAVDRLSSVSAATDQVEAMPLDLASMDSVRAFASRLTDKLNESALPALGAVVCNAGVASGTERTFTSDGFETTFAVNHLGHFLLINELLPTLRPPARLIVVASNVHDPASKSGMPAPAWNDVTALARGELGAVAATDSRFVGGLRRYSTSKLANVYFTYELARRVPDGVTANAFDPGLMPGTGFSRSSPAPVRFLSNHVLPHAIPLLRRLYNPNVHSAEESGQNLARLVTDPDLSSTTGKYFDGTGQTASSDESYDVVRAEQLWKESIALTSPA